MVKTALIAGGPLWERVRRGEPGVDTELVVACARTKLAVVAEDEIMGAIEELAAP